MSAFPLQGFKAVLALPPVSVASTTATQIAYVDLAGTGQALATANTGPVNPCEGVLWILVHGASTSSSGGVFKITEADTYNGSPTAYADIAGAAKTLDVFTSGKFSCIYVANRGRKRFQKAVVTTGATQIVSVFAIMCPTNKSASIAADISAQCEEVVRVG